MLFQIKHPIIHLTFPRNPLFLAACFLFMSVHGCTMCITGVGVDTYHFILLLTLFLDTVDTIIILMTETKSDVVLGDEFLIFGAHFQSQQTKLDHDAVSLVRADSTADDHVLRVSQHSDSHSSTSPTLDTPATGQHQRVRNAGNWFDCARQVLALYWALEIPGEMRPVRE